MNKVILVPGKLIAQKEFKMFGEFIDRIENISLNLKDVEAEIDYRQLVYWYNEGLLISDPQNGKLKNIGFIDYCWIHVVNLMRTYGMSISTIKVIKGLLFDTVDWLLILEQSGSLEKFLPLIPENEHASFINYIKELRNSPNNINHKISFFFISILDCLLYREPISFLVNTKNEVVIFKDSAINFYVNEPHFIDFYKGSYLKISISEIVWKFLKIEGTNIKDQQLEILSESEGKILKAIRAGDIKEISVKFGIDHEPEMLEIKKVEKVESSSRLLELIKANSYQNITLKTQDGKIAHYENTIKEKLQKANIK